VQAREILPPQLSHSTLASNEKGHLMKKLEVDITCPNCKKVYTVKVESMIPGKSTKCPKCSSITKFTGDDGRKAQKALDDFERSLKNMSKSFKINI
jgi:Zn finger protein HypA/HybF involved in hydrogenase expression